MDHGKTCQSRSKPRFSPLLAPCLVLLILAVDDLLSMDLMEEVSLDLALTD